MCVLAGDSDWFFKCGKNFMASFNALGHAVVSSWMLINRKWKIKHMQ